MGFAWDEFKNRTNRRKHGVSFETATRVFQDPQAVSYLDRMVDGEQRWHTIGLAGGIAVLLVVHVNEEEDGEEEIRIVSAQRVPRARSLQLRSLSGSAANSRIWSVPRIAKSISPMQPNSRTLRRISMSAASTNRSSGSSAFDSMQTCSPGSAAAEKAIKPT
jgi:uncharacterized DUF497 family protein